MIRTEQAADYQLVYGLHQQAFGGREDESQLVERIRHSKGFIPELSLVAEQEERIVGHALFSKATVEENSSEVEVLVLVPIAVLPVAQRRGIGSQLMMEGIRRSQSYGCPLLLLIGHPSYYPRFGFTPANAHGLILRQFQVPDEVFMVRELSEGQLGRIRGELKYPAAFFA